jgi:hypothetical protein
LNDGEQMRLRYRGSGPAAVAVAVAEKTVDSDHTIDRLAR